MVKKLLTGTLTRCRHLRQFVWLQKNGFISNLRKHLGTCFIWNPNYADWWHDSPHASSCCVKLKSKPLKFVFPLKCLGFKGAQTWDNFEFFLPKSKPYMALVNFPLIFARILMFEHFRVDWAYTETKFFDKLYQKKFFFKMFTLVLLDGFLDGFSKFWLIIVEICILIG